MGKVTKKRRRTWRTAGAGLLDEATIEALADEAESGYDLSMARLVPSPGAHGRRTSPGRPTLSRSNRGPSPRLSLRLTPEGYVAAHARAQAENRSLSAIARDALSLYVQRDPDRGS